MSTGPGKSAEQIWPSPRAPSGSPAGSSHLRQLADDDRRASARRPVCRSCVTMRSRRYGRSPTSSRNRT